MKREGQRAGESLNATEEFANDLWFWQAELLSFVLLWGKAGEMLFYRSWQSSSGQQGSISSELNFLKTELQNVQNNCAVVCFMCLCSLSSDCRLWLYVVSLMLCLLSVFFPSGPYGTQRTTWPHWSTCKYLLYSPNNTQARHTCRQDPVLVHGTLRTKAYNCSMRNAAYICHIVCSEIYIHL